MALKKRLKTLDGLDDAVKGLYKQQGEEFVLDLDDPDYSELKKKVDEFRNNNVTLSQQKEQLESAMKRFEGIDPEQWKEAKKALDTINQIEEKDLIKGGKFDEVINRRLSVFKNETERQLREREQRIAALEQNEKKYKDAFSRMKVETEVGRAIQQAASIRQGAVNDVMNRVRENWYVNDKDELVVRDLYDEDGKPLTPDKYAKHLLKAAPHLFEVGSGGGAGGGKKPGGQKEQKSFLKPNNQGITTVNGDSLRAMAEGKVGILSGGGDDSGDMGDVGGD